MPELPEVENIRLSLADQITGLSVSAVQIIRPDVLNIDHIPSTSPQSLLQRTTITNLIRHGKQLALVFQSTNNISPILCVGLGMTGQLRIHTPSRSSLPNHTHFVLDLVTSQDKKPTTKLIFRDPRRFGGLWLFQSHEDLLSSRWSSLGPDALAITPKDLHDRLSRTRRTIKAALLDQNLVAGLGNIYVDELLHRSGIHPEYSAGQLTRKQIQTLVPKMRRLLRNAIQSGGSTLRDYVNGVGDLGGYQNNHKVYGRSGQPCTTCDHELEGLILAGRSTVFCPSCQPAG
ncbi:bifunctional DNA-formamidopyrimidine glycosylase/DNA-(apurinic or apyrimidinic site) lyase [Poriferisphaera sp. WC338]|uniref:bifunctional DNA-formamidopyrimidine glycosylase/DNA-(apurinic or apyrimidinic site) lyase n=1 Tax=Poriferisphaera sp. WC338 TaxID=3425129 RepID=UPI003D81B3BB